MTDKKTVAGVDPVTGIAHTENNVHPLQSWAAYHGESFLQLSESAAVNGGADLVKADSEGNHPLIGVPFVIVNAQFRVGAYMSATTKEKGPYVTLEIVTGDEAAFARAIKRGRITADCPIDPEEELVFNEGGTGVYRQIVEAWEKLGWISLPEGPLNGASGDSRLDTPLNDWGYPTGTPVEAHFDNDDNTVCEAPTRLLCRRGLRVSKYENDYTKEGNTRYIA